MTADWQPCRDYRRIEKALAFLHSRRAQQPSLRELAEHCACSEYHLQRLFKRWAGVSPKQFLQFLNREYALARLAENHTVELAAEQTGLSGSGRLHDLLVRLDAVSPGEVRRRGEDLRFFYGVHPSPFGECLLIATARGIHRLVFVDSEPVEQTLSALRDQWPLAQIEEDVAATQLLATRVFNGAELSDPLTLWISGTPFQFKVWEALLQIPSGELCNYQAIAQIIGQPRAARAVGTAIGSNPVAWLIPCHRVIQSIGESGQYHWGAVRKQSMLGREAAARTLKSR